MKIGIKATIGPAAVPFAIATMLLADRAASQQPIEPGLQQTAFTRPVSETTGERVHFSRRAARVGDEVEQNISLEMQLTMLVRQANQIVGKNRTSVHNNQRRVVTTTAVDSGRLTAVKVRYAVATKQVSTFEANETSTESALLPQPVQGKTYVCRREPGENGQLIVTDPASNRPPSDEYEIVSQQMQMVGRPNPLAQFLADRTIRVGEKIELPNDSASQIFNLSDKLGKVTRFTLTLQKTASENGAACAEFLASVEAVSSDATQMRLEVEGPLMVEVDTCRAARVSLVGPIAMSETRGSYSTACQMIGTGRLNMNVASLYRDASR